jgi:ABC-type Na+ transport system ATPase subunit NatA
VTVLLSSRILAETEALCERVTIIRALGDAGVRSLISQPPTLEELFLRRYHTAEVSS